MSRFTIFQVRRYFPVANLTRTRQAVILEPLRPERFFVRTFNATSLYILSVCEVCGSYQCPYCPTFSSSISVIPGQLFLAISVTFSSLFHFFKLRDFLLKLDRVLPDQTWPRKLYEQIVAFYCSNKLSKRVIYVFTKTIGIQYPLCVISGGMTSSNVFPI